MPLRAARIVRVTTEQELDDALASADQVIVEGDDRLLSLAVAKASGDPGNDISLQIEGERTASSSAPLPSIVQPLPPHRMSPPSSRPSRHRIFAACLLIILLAGMAWVITQTFQKDSSAVIPQPSPTTASPSAAPRPGDEPEPNVALPEPTVALPGPKGTTVELVQTVTWPAVSIVAIITVFLIARQAIAGGRNVEITWKVTEKVTGRVVITKVKAPAAKTTRAASKAA